MKEFKAYIIDFGLRGMEDVRKCVTFFFGVGVLDHQAVALQRPDIYGPGDGGPYPRPSGQYASFDLLAIAEYFLAQGATVTEVTEAEAEKVRNILASGKLPAKKYLSPTLEPSGEGEGAGPAGGGSGVEGDTDAPELEEDAGPVTSEDLEEPADAPAPKGKKGKGGK